jgi:hypothetical protein
MTQIVSTILPLFLWYCSRPGAQAIVSHLLVFGTGKCPECGQTICSQCNCCHYCEDIDLPCAGLLSSRPAVTGAARYRQRDSQLPVTASAGWYVIRPGGSGPTWPDDGNDGQRSSLPLPFYNKPTTGAAVAQSQEEEAVLC